MKQKLSSRKFWAAVAAFLLSLSTSISGMHSDNAMIVIFGTICGVASAAIYAAAEAYVDGAYSTTPKEENNDILEPAIGYQIDSVKDETEE